MTAFTILAVNYDLNVLNLFINAYDYQMILVQN